MLVWGLCMSCSLLRMLFLPDIYQSFEVCPGDSCKFGNYFPPIFSTSSLPYPDLLFFHSTYHFQTYFETNVADLLRLLHIISLKTRFLKGNKPCSLCSLIYPKYLEVCLVHSRCLIDIFKWMNHLFQWGKSLPSPWWKGSIANNPQPQSTRAPEDLTLHQRLRFGL